MHVRYSYLPQQFENCEDLWQDLRKFVSTGDFTLGKELKKFEQSFANLMGTKFAIGVNSGTDAIKLSLRAFGVGTGDEVITAANTFVATVGAICEIGAKPVFIDCDDTFCMDTMQLEGAITSKTKAIVPVHFTGYMSNMEDVMRIADKHNLVVVEDACQSILGEFNGKKAGTWGQTGAFSLHPLKNLNVWSDGGIIVTDNPEVAEKLRLLRNHGLIDRDNVEILGYNSRLDTLQAVVGNWLIPQTEDIAEKRILNAKHYDEGLGKITGISIPPRPDNYKIVYHLYIVFAEQRDALLDYCHNSDIEAKVHYPIPIYRQNALSSFGHKYGDFPVTDRHAESVISFPCDQHLSTEQIDYTIEVVKRFYG
jgi:aminotransferase EvaB